MEVLLEILLNSPQFCLNRRILRNDTQNLPEVEPTVLSVLRFDLLWC